MITLPLFIIAIIVMLILAFGIIFFVVMYQRRVMRHHSELKLIQDRQQLELVQASIRAEEEERMRIASELHDDVGATLSSVRLFLHASAKKDADPDIILQSKELLDESISKVRNISHKLQPAMLQQLGLHAALQSFAATISKPGNIAMVYRSPALPRLHEDIELAVYRIVQELTSNIIRHSAATAIDLDALMIAHKLHVTLSHDGQGLTGEAFNEQVYKQGSIGLKNIVNRLKTINATIAFGQGAEGCYLTTITVPALPQQ